MHSNYLNEEAIEELKARLKWIQVLGSDKKVYLAIEDNESTDVEFKPVKAVTLMTTDSENYKLLDLGFQYKGLGKTLIIRNICAFNWLVLTRSERGTSETAKLTLFCLANTPSSEPSIITKSYVLKFTDSPNEQQFAEDYVMIS
ncbi:hypothetical protein V6C27_07210 [Peptococcaceae bacterium 1198_IL3148]